VRVEVCRVERAELLVENPRVERGVDRGQMSNPRLAGHLV